MTKPGQISPQRPKQMNYAQFIFLESVFDWPPVCIISGSAPTGKRYSKS